MTAPRRPDKKRTAPLAVKVGGTYLLLGWLGVGVTDLLLFAAGRLPQSYRLALTVKDLGLILASALLVAWLVARLDDSAGRRAPLRAGGAQGWALFNALFERSMEAILLARPEGRIVAANPAACELLAMPEEELRGRDRFEILDPLDPNLQRMIEERRRTGRARGEVRVRRGDGRWIIADLSSVLFRDEHGEEHTGVIMRDVTPRHEAERRLRASDERFRRVAEHTGQVIYEHDPATGATVFAGSCREVLGYSAEELSSMRGAERMRFVHPADVDALLRTIRRAVEQAGSYRLEYRIRNLDGQYLHVQERGSYSAAHQRLYGVLQDISARERLLHELAEREQTLRLLTRQQESVLDALPAHIALLDEKGVIRFVNRAWREFGRANGYPHRNFGIGADYLAICERAEPPCHEGAREVATAIREVMSGRCAEFSRDYPCHSAGQRRWFRALITPVPQSEGTGALITHFNITEQVEAQYRLRLLAAAFESADEAMVICDRDFLILDINEAFVRQTGLTRAEVLNTPPSFMDIPQQARAIRNGVQRNRNWHGELLIRRADGRLFMARANVSEVRSPDDESINYVIDFNDLSEQHEYERQIDYLSYHDSLTGLPNLPALRQMFTQLEKGRDATGRRMALVYFDLDRFKAVNETYGHSLGDLLLQETVRRIQNHCRPRDYLARPGGDELILLLRDIGSRQDAAGRVQEILTHLADPFKIEHRVIYTAASAGICLYPNDGDNLEDLLRRSDAALAAAKAQGKGRAVLFEPAMNVEVEEKLHIERELRAAVAGDELRLHFQPSVDLRDGRIAGLEALVRWESSRLGLVSPGRFIPVAEESGLIVELGHWVIEESCRQLARWRERGLETGTLAINVSPVQFAHADLLPRLRATLRKHRVPPQLLRLEITEGVLVMEPTRTVEILESLQSMGVSVALDDFGTGYSSMAYLKQFPIQYLKLDRAFISSLLENEKNASIVLSVIELAHRLDMAVIAEGVEQRREAERLRDWGCEFAQGYYFSRPLPAGEIAALLAAGTPLPAR